MGRQEFDNWLSRTLDFQYRITIGACVGMACLSLVLLIIHAGLLFLIAAACFNSNFMGAMLTTVIFVMKVTFVNVTAPRILRDRVHEGYLTTGSCKLRLAPTLAVVWTYAMGSMDTDRSLIERFLSILMMGPRCSWTVWYLFQRIDEVKQINREDSSQILRFLLKKSEAVTTIELSENFPDIDLIAAIRDVSLIDGVVFLTKSGFAISLAKRFVDAVEKELYGEPSTSDSSRVFDD